MLKKRERRCGALAPERKKRFFFLFTLPSVSIKQQLLLLLLLSVRRSLFKCA